VVALFRDLETRGQAALNKVGVHVYAADPTTEVLCCAYAIADGPVQLWLPGAAVPAEFIEAAANPAWIIVAHNDAFETAIERHIMEPRHDWPSIPAERRRCTLAMSLACGLPGRLSAVADALELRNRKDAAGARLMQQLSKPRRPHKDESPDQVYWFEDAERLRRLYDYCKQDVEAERELFHRLPLLSPAEQALWEFSSRINARGFCVDYELAEAARKIVEQAGPKIDAELAEITSGAVTAIGQVARLLEWLRAQGCSLESLQRDEIEEALAQEGLPFLVRRALELRLNGAQAGAKKVFALLERAGNDRRVRGSFRYHGAATGRWSGEGFQAQNLKRPTIDIEPAIAAIATGDYEHVRKHYSRPLAVIGDCSRSMVCAAPGHALIGADFSSIESRVLAWVAGEHWKLDSYRRFDATHDPRDEVYCQTACAIFGKPASTFTKDSPERQVGKVCDLAFGYAGGVVAFRKFSDAFSDEEVEKFKKDWRASHPAISRFWYEIDRAAVAAVRQRGEIVRCGAIAFRAEYNRLRLRLPSSRKIIYPQPEIIIDARGQPRVSFTDNSAGQFKPCRNGAGAYGGLWTENVVQAISRDLLAAAMLRLEHAGYPIVLHVHDELVAEVPIGFGSTADFTRLMTINPRWALDLPIAATAWSGQRYCK
jgi:DNA polymerase